jgi:hypothetical protein
MLALAALSSLPSVMAHLSALSVLGRRCRALSRPSVLSSVRAARRRGLLRSPVSSSARWVFRRGARLSLALARPVAAQSVSLPHARRSVTFGGPWGRKTIRLPSRSASAFSGGSSWRWLGLPSASALGSFALSSGASCFSIRSGANPAVNRTPGKLRLPVPSGLRPPVAGYLQR